MYYRYIILYRNTLHRCSYIAFVVGSDCESRRFYKGIDFLSSISKYNGKHMRLCLKAIMV